MGRGEGAGGREVEWKLTYKHQFLEHKKASVFLPTQKVKQLNTRPVL